MVADSPQVVQTCMVTHECIIFVYILLYSQQIERVIEDRARSVDVVKHKYYDLLYCFHTTRQNYRKGMYLLYSMYAYRKACSLAQHLHDRYSQLPL